MQREATKHYQVRYGYGYGEAAQAVDGRWSGCLVAGGRGLLVDGMVYGGGLLLDGAPPPLHVLPAGRPLTNQCHQCQPLDSHGSKVVWWFSWVRPAYHT